jgi:hypothetical protein
MRGYAVVSCHAERPLDDEVWRHYERLLERRPGGFAVTSFLRPPAHGENGDVWRARARRAGELSPLGHHTHWGGPTQARPPAGVDPSAVVRSEIDWLRSNGVEPRYFCGGGWYLDATLAGTLARHDYVDCTATTFRQAYLPVGAARLELPGPRRLLLAGGETLLELPATHSIGALARGLLRIPAAEHVHVHFHDWELLRPARRAAIYALLRALGHIRRPLSVESLAARSAGVTEIAWDEATIAS